MSRTCVPHAHIWVGRAVLGARWVNFLSGTNPLGATRSTGKSSQAMRSIATVCGVEVLGTAGEASAYYVAIAQLERAFFPNVSLLDHGFKQRPANRQRQTGPILPSGQRIHHPTSVATNQQVYRVTLSVLHTRRATYVGSGTESAAWSKCMAEKPSALALD